MKLTIKDIAWIMCHLVVAGYAIWSIVIQG
jgi:hypothetical protein